ncbi:MAG: pilus assembly protein PilP [Pseudomonadota bacterium]
MTARLSFPALLLMMMFLVTSGCKEEQKSQLAKAPPQKPAAKPAPAKSAETEMPSLFDRSTEEYSYNPIGKRDPFLPYSEEAVIEDVNQPKSPLERYPLEQLKVTAIVWGISDPRALVQAPDSQSYIVRKNMRIGINRGRISKITRRSLYVEEEYRDPTGKLVVNEQNLEIRPEEKKEGEAQMKMSDE